MFLWPIFILDTFKGQKARFTSVFERFTNDLQEDVTENVSKKLIKGLKSGYKTVSECTFCFVYNLVATNFQRSTIGKPLGVKEIFFYLFFIKQLQPVVNRPIYVTISESLNVVIEIIHKPSYGVIMTSFSMVIHLKAVTQGCNASIKQRKFVLLIGF